MKEKLVLICYLVFYILLLNIAYIFIIAPNYGYMGYVYIKPSYFHVLTNIFISLVPVLFMKTSLKRPSELVNWILYVIVIIPTAFIPLYTVTIDHTLIILLEIVLVVNLYMLTIISKLPLIRISKLKSDTSLFWGLFLAIYFIFYGVMFKTYGLKFNLQVLKDVSDVYGLRESYREASNKFSIYILNWLSKVINPLLIIMGIFYKRKSLIVWGFLGQLSLFMISGHKTFLFSILLLFGLYIALKNNGKVFGYSLVFGLLIIVFFSTTIDYLLNSTFLTSMFVRRLIIVPGYLTGVYYEFFSINEKAHWAYSFLKPLLDYPYSLNPAFLIGKVYFADPATSANANLWADGFANFGFLGVFAMTLLLGLILWIYDSLMKKDELVFYSLFLGMIAINLTNTSLLTSIVTHGLFLVFIIAFILPKLHVLRRSQ